MTLTLGLLVDILLVAVIAINLIRGYNDGFLATLFRFLVWLFSFIIAVFLCKYLAEALYDGVFHEKVVAAFSEMKIIKDSNGNIMVEESIATVSGIVGTIMMFAKGSIGAMLGSVDSRLVEFGLKKFGEQISSSVIKPMFVNIVSIVLFLVVVLVLALVFNIIVKVLKLVNEVPVLGKVNQLGGLATGLAVGLVWCLVIAQGAQLVFMVLNKSIDPTPLSENTFIFQFFYKIKLFH